METTAFPVRSTDPPPTNSPYLDPATSRHNHKNLDQILRLTLYRYKDNDTSQPLHHYTMLHQKISQKDNNAFRLKSRCCQ